MAKLPTYKEIIQGALPDAPEWLPALLVPLNQFFRLVFNALDRKLTLADNFDIQEFSIKVTGGETFQFPLTLTRPAKLVLIAQFSPLEYTGAVAPVWQQISFQDKPTIQVVSITGLNIGQTYDARIIVL